MRREAAGFGFAQGKTMLWRRDILEAGGGIEALGAEIAEDAAATKLIQRAGLSAHLVDRPFQQPLGARRLKDVWSRQLRWARLRRATFPLYFAPEILTTSLFTLAAAGVAAPVLGAPCRPRGRRGGGLLVRRGGPPRLRRRLAAHLAHAVRLDRPRPPPARPVGARLDGSGDVVWRGNAMNVDETMFGEAESGPRPQI